MKVKEGRNGTTAVVCLETFSPKDTSDSCSTFDWICIPVIVMSVIAKCASRLATIPIMPVTVPFGKGPPQPPSSGVTTRYLKVTEMLLRYTLLLLLLKVPGEVITPAICESRLHLDKQQRQELPKRGFHPPPETDIGKQLREINLNNLLKFVTSLTAASPPHHLYLLYDEYFSGVVSSVVSPTISRTATTVMKIPSETLNLKTMLSYPLTYSTIPRRHILVFTSLENIVTLYEEVSRENLESPWIWWIVLVLSKEAKQILQGILREGSQVILVEVLAQDVLQIYSSKIDTSGLYKFDKAATWRSSFSGSKSGLLSRAFVDLDTLYSDFQGRRLTVTANQWPPFVSMVERDDGELELVSGLDASMIETMGNALNFTIRMVTTSDGAWGIQFPNGSVNGMIGMVYRREAHFAACELTISDTREVIIDFTYPYYLEIFTLVSPAPKQKGRTFAVFSPFTNEVWLCIASITFVLGLLLYILARIAASYLHGTPKGYTVSDMLFNVFRSLTTQENMLIVDNDPLNLSFTFWYFFCLIVTTCYSSMLIATLVKPSFEKPIESLADLPDALRNGFIFAISPGGLTEEMFREAKDGIYADTWKLLLSQDPAKSFYDDFTAIQDKILTERIIITRAQTVATYTIMQKGARQYHIAREPITFDSYGIACFSGAPFQNKFTQKLFQMVEGGLVKKWANNEFMKVAGKNPIEPSGHSPFTLDQLQAAFYLLFIGYLASASALGIELLTGCRSVSE